MLFIRGGEVFQRMLTVKMNENEQKFLNLEHVSLDAVRALLTYFYLGNLKAKSFQGKEEVLLELFEMANLYQIQGLIDCCTNMISVLIRDREVIFELYATYRNKHLQELYEYLDNEVRKSKLALIKYVG